MSRSWASPDRVKTTLLNILAALDRPTEGEVLLNGKNPCDGAGKMNCSISAGASWLCVSGFSSA